MNIIKRDILALQKLVNPKYKTTCWRAVNLVRYTDECTLLVATDGHMFGCIRVATCDFLDVGFRIPLPKMDRLQPNKDVIITCNPHYTPQRMALVTPSAAQLHIVDVQPPNAQILETTRRMLSMLYEPSKLKPNYEAAPLINNGIHPTSVALAFDVLSMYADVKVQYPYSVDKIGGITSHGVDYRITASRTYIIDKCLVMVAGRQGTPPTKDSTFDSELAAIAPYLTASFV